MFAVFCSWYMLLMNIVCLNPQDELSFGILSLSYVVAYSSYRQMNQLVHTNIVCSI